jgi:selenocysteine lyase/cysteine desulfurase
VTIRWAEFHKEDCTLDVEDLAAKINSKTKLVAVGLASNAVGTINPVKEIIRLAHAVGALAYIDAVHYAPHGLIDVKDLDCDFLVCSTYKFFGPHMGVLFGKREHLTRLRPYKVRPLTEAIPCRWEWGTLNHECIAGITACVDYIADLGRPENHTVGLPHPTPLSSGGNTDTRLPHPTRVSLGGNNEAGVPHVSPNLRDVGPRRASIISAFEAIHRHEDALMSRLIAGVKEIPTLKIYGITDPSAFAWRCPTLAVRHLNQNERNTPAQLAAKLGDLGFFTWDGNYYALNLTERLNVESSGGFLRIGLAHYNTVEEVNRFLAALKQIVEE